MTSASNSLEESGASEPRTPRRLVDAEGLLFALFDKDSRPSLRWIREMQAQRRIPYYKIGRLVRFDVEKVRTALADQWAVEPRSIRRR